MPKVIAVINKRTGAVTIKAEGFTGDACLKATERLRDGLGITAEPERTDAFYATEETNQQQEQGQG